MPPQQVYLGTSIVAYGFFVLVDLLTAKEINAEEMCGLEQ